MMSALLDRDVPMDRRVFYSVHEALDWLRPGQVDELLAAHEEAVERGL